MEHWNLWTDAFKLKNSHYRLKHPSTFIPWENTRELFICFTIRSNLQHFSWPKACIKFYYPRIYLLSSAVHINDSILHVEDLWEFFLPEKFSNLSQKYFLRELFSSFKLFIPRCGSGPVGAIIALVLGSGKRNGKEKKKGKPFSFFTSSFEICWLYPWRR